MAVVTSTPNQIWFYNLEDVVFSSTSSYDTDGYVNYTEFYINGIKQAEVSYTGAFTRCFALYGSPDNDCYELASGVTTVTVGFKVRDNQGEWSELETQTYTIQEHKGRKYFVMDHLGSVRATVNRDGNVLGYSDYYPFGLELRSNNTANPNDNYKYTSHEMDVEAGLDLIYAGARYMDPVIGRWQAIDPLADKYPGLSPYNYTMNNPVNAFDPDGRLVIFINGLSNNPGLPYWGDPDIQGDAINSVWKMLRAAGDTHGIFYDGSMGGTASFFKGGIENNLVALNRWRAGFLAGSKDASKIFQSLAPEESIKLVTHSMGGIYGMGFARALLDYQNYLLKTGQLSKAHRISIVNTDMFQAGSLYGRLDGEISILHLYQGGCCGDNGWLANDEQEGAENVDEGGTGHSWVHFMQSVIDWLLEQSIIDEEQAEELKGSVGDGKSN